MQDFAQILFFHKVYERPVLQALDAEHIRLAKAGIKDGLSHKYILLDEEHEPRVLYHLHSWLYYEVCPLCILMQVKVVDLLELSRPKGGALRQLVVDQVLATKDQVYPRIYLCRFFAYMLCMFKQVASRFWPLSRAWVLAMQDNHQFVERLRRAHGGSGPAPATGGSPL